MARAFLLRTLSKVLRRVSFESHGREGAAIYHEGLKTLRFYMELGGNDALFYLSFPETEKWESMTGFSLEERDDIIRYVAEMTQRHQAPSCSYSINDTEITFKKNI